MTIGCHKIQLPILKESCKVIKYLLTWHLIVKILESIIRLSWDVEECQYYFSRNIESYVLIIEKSIRKT